MPLGLGTGVWAQTAIDLRTQTKDVNFSDAGSTEPFQTGTSLPSTCTTGAAFLDLAATAGQNIYLCTATNIWTQQDVNQSITWTASGDIGGTASGTTSLAPALTVTGLRGAPLPALSTGNLRYSGGAWDFDSTGYLSSMWGSGSRPVAANALGTSGDCAEWGPVGLVDAGAPCGSGSGASMFQQMGDFALTYGGSSGTIGAKCSPSTPCIAGLGYSVYSFTAPATVTESGTGNDTLYVYVNSAGTLIVGYSGSAAPTCAGCAVAAGITGYPAGVAMIGRFTVSGGSIAASVSDRASITGPPTLAAGSNVTLSTAGNVVTISSSGGGSASLPSTAVQTNQTNTYTTGTQDFHAATHTLPMVTGTAASKPSTCTTGETYFATDATAGQNIYFCTATNTWTPMAAGSGYNPADQTQLFMSHLATDSGFNQANSWTYTVSGSATSGGCSFSSDLFSQSLVGGVCGQTGTTANSSLAFYWPFGSSDYQAGFYDVFSGSTPAWLYLSTTYQSLDSNGTHYVGLFASYGSTSEFIGCRAVGSGDWFAVIRHSGADVATADTGLAHDTNVHRFQVDNGASGATANSIRCLVDGARVATASGTVPAEPASNGGWFFGVSVTNPAASNAVVAFYRYQVWLRGLPIN
ncbi:MAG: hypothetical protein ABSH56_28435 [Bryobacteraceae bacterium]